MPALRSSVRRLSYGYFKIPTRQRVRTGLNALFGMEYDRYENQHAEIYDTEASDRAFEEEVMLVGFGNAPTKAKVQGFNSTMQMKRLLLVTHTKQLHLHSQ